MKTFDPVDFDLDQARQGVVELGKRLTSNRPLRERRDILPFFRARPSLASLCGCYGFTLLRCDRLAWEYDLFGDFYCDLAIGDSVTRSYTFVEFEDATPSSLFVRQGKKATREWSPRFLRGFAQLVDWFGKLEDSQKSDAFEARFGKRSIDCAGLLVVGRDRHLEAGERLRLGWWRENVLVRSRRIHCVTYDELAEDLLGYLERLAAARRPPRRGRRK
jgi:hypothetical protein